MEMQDHQEWYNFVDDDPNTNSSIAETALDRASIYLGRIRVLCHK